MKTTNVIPFLLERGHPTMPKTILSQSILLFVSILTNGLVENLIGLLTMLTIPVKADHGRCLHSKLTGLPVLHILGLNVSLKSSPFHEFDMYYSDLRFLTWKTDLVCNSENFNGFPVKVHV